MKTHKLKTIQPYFDRVWQQSKTFEVRKNDRDFQKGDKIFLQEYDAEKGSYSGREVFGEILYVLYSYPAIQEGYVVFSFCIDQYINPKDINKGNPPHYCKLIIDGKDTLFELSDKRSIGFSIGEKRYDDPLQDDEVFYQTVFGWGIIVNKKTWIVSNPKNTFYEGKEIMPISLSEFGDGVFI